MNNTGITEIWATALVVFAAAVAVCAEVSETDEAIVVATDRLEAAIRKKGYVSGVAGGSFLDKKTGFRDAGFGLDVVDWIMEPGSDRAYRDKLDKELVYEFDNAVHGKTAKRSIEGPQVCTQAKELQPEIVRGKGFTAIRQRFTYRTAAPGKKAGSQWEQTIVFPEGARYFLSTDKITAVNGSQGMFLRIDMPGHIRHNKGDTFSEVYLSYLGRIPASEFSDDFAPDERFNYTRARDRLPDRFIRAYRLRDSKTGRDGPWLAGMTLFPGVVSEAWCYQRGYVCMIEEFGGHPVEPGESFSAAFIVGYFDSIEEMHEVYDRHKGTIGLKVDSDGWEPIKADTSDERLAQRLDWFKDQKFGLFLHWGAYSQMGCIESWPLVYADRSWSNPSIKTFEEMIEFRKKYFALNKTFNPAKFRPEQWAALAKGAGMKYVMFTTKHHDGFSMFDTKQTDYRVTAPDCAYSKSPQPDIVRSVFDAFRRDGFGIGAYFSKSDWHHPCYWDPDRPALDRNPNYDTLKEPERWEKFARFVRGQVEELMTNYGRVDILWLDGGQVRQPKQDIRMTSIAEMARGHQPDLIVVDRTAGTKHENYRTPEQKVPDQPLPYVWESCLTMGRQWSYKPDDEYKSAGQLIHLLIDVVAKGGNLLLNIGPQPDGRLPAPATQRLREIGDWMDVNGEAIHGTRPVPPYKEGSVALTGKGDAIYAIHMMEEGRAGLPAEILVPRVRIRPGAKARLLGSRKLLECRATEQGTVVEVPPSLARRPPCKHACVFKLVGHDR